MSSAVLKYKILMIAALATASCAAPSASSDRVEASGKLELLTSVEIGEPGKVDLRETTSPGRVELLMSYREVTAAEPEAARGRLFTMVYSWNPEARSLLPVRLIDGDLPSSEASGSIFHNDACFHYEITTTRWDFLLRGLRSDPAISIVASVKPGPRMPIPEQTLSVNFGTTGGQITLDPEIQNLFYANAKATDIDGDGLNEAVIAVAYYKNRALFILGDPRTPWKQIELPHFTSYAAAGDFLRRHEQRR